MRSESPSLRERQVNATRDLILDVAMDMMRQNLDTPFSHENIAHKAGIGARTVYRHFPSRADLLQALWERLREETKTRFPQHEAEIAELTRVQFAHFDEHAALVRASLSAAAADVRGRGSVQGRAEFRRCLAPILAELSLAQQRRLIAVCLAIYSAAFWEHLRNRGELSGPEAQEAGAWALEAILDAARSERRRPVNQKNKPQRRTRNARRKP